MVLCVFVETGDGAMKISNVIPLVEKMLPRDSIPVFATEIKDFFYILNFLFHFLMLLFWKAELTEFSHGCFCNSRNKQVSSDLIRQLRIKKQGLLQSCTRFLFSVNFLSTIQLSLELLKSFTGGSTLMPSVFAYSNSYTAHILNNLSPATLFSSVTTKMMMLIRNDNGISNNND